MRVEITVPVGEQVTRLQQRQTEQPAPRWRGEAERDRDRILYSSAFQRLGGVTQVTANEPGHTFHTRLTHSLKVAQVARAVASRLKQQPLTGTASAVVESLDPAAVETAGLAHDLGHPPFGHIAEQLLNERMRSSGGFEGNAQSFRIVTRLAVQAPHPPGLNLTRETLNGLLKYPWQRGESGPSAAKWGVYSEDMGSFTWAREDSTAEEPSLVARLMDWADDVTYAVHDVDDFFRAGLVPLDRLAIGGPELDRLQAALVETERASDVAEADAMIAVLHEVLGNVFRLREPYTGTTDQRLALRGLGSKLIGRYVDVVTLHDPLVPGKAILTIDEDAVLLVKALKALTWVYVVRRPSLAVLQHGQQRIIAELFERYLVATTKAGDRRLLPPAYQDRLDPEAEAPARIRLVGDLIASLSEAAAVELYRRYMGVTSGSAMDAAARAV